MDKLPAWIVVVDDEEPVRRALVRLMRSAGIAAYAYASGEEFLHSLQLCIPDCLLLDLNLPGMSGFEIQARLAVEAPELPVILITGHDSPDTRKRVMRTHPLAYLQKPIDDQLLLDTLALAMQQRALKTDGEQRQAKRDSNDGNTL